MKTEAINLKIVEHLYKDPHQCIDSFDLLYTTDAMLTILRAKYGNTFIYTEKDKRITSKNVIKRIASLVIPPKWNSVKIANVANAHLQAVGRDAKGRKQYKYHPKWSKLHNQTKFYKMAAFGEKLPQIRHQVEKDLKQRQWTQTKTLALIVKLLEETHIRIGNEQYAKKNKTYGLTTLRSRHLSIKNNKMRFEFVGKRGKKHSVTLKNKKLMRLVNQCEELPGWELFKYFDENGNKHTIDSGMVNDYIHKLSGRLFTAKDYRTWSASIITFEYLKSMGVEANTNQNKKNILSAIDQARNALGNTRAVLRKYYLHPHIINCYENGNIATAFNISDSINDDAFFTASEKAMLQLIKTFKPKF